MNDSASKLEQRGYKVSLLQDNDHKRWDEFVEASPGGTFFHLSGWKNILEQVLRHPTRYFLCERQGSVVGVLPLAQVKSLLFGNVLVSLPFLVYGGAVSSDPVAEEMLVDAARDEATRMGVDHLELRNKLRSSRDWLVKDKYATFSKRLDPDPEKKPAGHTQKATGDDQEGHKSRLAGGGRQRRRPTA